MQASPFDELASEYDRSFTRSACGMTLRAMVWERLPRVFGTRHRILEIGCGTGEDAVHLARAGHRVVAIDASEEMIRIARLKAISAGCADRIEFHAMPIEALHTLPREQRFDGVFSNFGAINCVADVGRLAHSLASRLQRGAPLMFVVMGRHVPWEWAWYLAHGDRQRAFRRLRREGAPWRGLHHPVSDALRARAALAPHVRDPAARGAGLHPAAELRRAMAGFAAALAGGARGAPSA